MQTNVLLYQIQQAQTLHKLSQKPVNCRLLELFYFLNHQYIEIVNNRMSQAVHKLLR